MRTQTTLLLLAALACSGPETTRRGDPHSGADAFSSGDVAPGDAAGDPSTAGDSAGDTGGDTGGSLDCTPARGPGASATDEWLDGSQRAAVTIDNRDSCERTYTLSTNAALRDSLPGNPRVFSEPTADTVLRSGNDLFDALYALAREELRQLSVDEIQDSSYDAGQPVDCGGCFETGRLWTWVWTRDIAYAATLGAAAVDPTRTRQSLEFKLSLRRDGSDLQVVQDTGTGGSYPISSDRVTWALGAWEVLHYLDGAERTAFRELAYDALVNTIAHDRALLFDADDGLYRGETSFLDWREQSYPGWVATDTVHIGMSKALSTNIAHHGALVVAARLATEKSLPTAATLYQGWADTLATAIRERFYLSAAGLFSSFLPTELDAAPVSRFDLLGSALAVSTGIATPTQASSVVEHYPHLSRGAPAIWPQQQFTPIYHNRAVWPFTTGMWLRAAKKVKNAAVVNHGMRALLRGAALHLSNMESFEAVTGETWVDDGDYSGPVVNSHRQLWSVAAYLGMVHEILFGIEASASGIRFAPFVPVNMRDPVFAGANSIALSRFAYRGRRIDVVMHLGAVGSGAAALEAASVRVNGTEVGTSFVDASSLLADNLVEITLAPATGTSEAMTLVADEDTADYRNLFGPRTPSITSIGINADRVELTVDAGGESGADIRYNIYRDSTAVATDLDGNTTTWIDASSSDHASRSYCYTVESVFVSSGTASQRAAPMCYWGPGYDRIQTIGAASFTAVGGTLVNEYGKDHYQDWGDPTHTLTVQLTPAQGGLHLIQLEAGNGAGPFNTGITCAVKLVEVTDASTPVASGYVIMPHLDTWDAWRGSSFLPVELDAGTTYTITIREDARAINMSELAGNELYGGTGGSVRFNRVNIAELKLLTTEIR